MRKAGRITGEAILAAREHIKEGISTKELDTIIRNYIEKCGAKPSFLGYGGFPGSACISINNEVIHGIPSAKRFLEEGDIVKIDVGAYIGGFHGDSANTFGVGKISEEAQKLIDVTRESFYRGIKMAVSGKRVGDIGSEIASYAEGLGYGVVRKFVGHGIGREMHEAPEVPNYGRKGNGLQLRQGMCLAIEPMITLGKRQIFMERDGWTVRTRDRKNAAHFEHTIAVGKNGADILSSFEFVEEVLRSKGY
jgi:methionyl aminopeptidase